MKIALFGATGMIGQRIMKEALKRGHEVTAILRDTTKLASHSHEHLQVVTGDILVPQSVAVTTTGKDVVISAFGPQFGAEDELAEAARSLVEGVKTSGAGRLLIVGGAGSLEVEQGGLLMDSPGFPEEWRPLARAHAEAYEVFSHSDVDWTYLSPAAIIEPGERTGFFRIGMNRLVTDEVDQSRISAEDYAVALLDEVDEGHFIRGRFTVAY
ncbi:putative NADH-flavin reductase [Paenibacillus shirakamiensis]|uniref:NADH-flavin reductase n=1 Tax=Paenibacillus shirakamiensis TaxID=1265935 RepID=A0ABS4JM04_9BACL|nr:NAD(P)-dependent oxidoreductase [Paenibacillus shirakamiensis]MBP2001614.1 putative NADH-flavin reductase [Paenibacillus shirakamiensis]